MSKPVLSPASSSKAPEEHFLELATTFSKACKEVHQPSKALKKEKNPSTIKLTKKFGELEEAYRVAAKGLKGRGEPLKQIEAEHAKAQKLFVQLFSPAAERVQGSKTGIRGITNHGNDCAFNALLQMIFHVPFLREALLAVPAFAPLRKASARYFGLEQGQVNSHQIRQMVNAIVDPENDNQELEEENADASEALTLMLSMVSPNIAAERFPLMRNIKTFEPTGKKKPVIGDIDRSRLDMNHSVTTMTRNQILHIDAFRGRDPHERKGKSRTPKEADFDSMLGLALDARGHSVGETGYFLGADPNFLYEHRPVRDRIVFAEMPNHLILTTNRFKANGDVNDTPMQMPRVLTLPQGALAQPTDDRRLVLKSFIVHKPGHYVAYVRNGNQWYLCDDGVIEPVTIKQVDKVLHHYTGGGSYVHFYERGDADAELPLAYNLQPKTKGDVTLEKLQKRAASKKATNEELLKIFDELPKKEKDVLYGKVWDKVAKGPERHIPDIGKKLLRQNVRVLFEHKILKPIDPASISPKKTETTKSQMEIVLDLREALNKTKTVKQQLAIFNQLDPQYRTLAYTLICKAKEKPDNREYGKSKVQKDPLSLHMETTHDKQKARIIDHLLVAATFHDNTPPSAPSSDKPDLDKTGYLDKINKMGNAAMEMAKQITEKQGQADIQKYIEEVHSKFNQLLNEKNDPEIWASILKNADLEFKEVTLLMQECVKTGNPIPPRKGKQPAAGPSDPAQEVDAIGWQQQISSQLPKRGNRETLMKLFEDGQKGGWLNQKFPEFAGGTIFHHIVKLERLQEYIPSLLRLGADLAIQDNSFGNTPLMWAIANAGNGRAREMIRMGGPQLDKQCKTGNNTALHLAVGKGYKKMSVDGQLLDCTNLELVNELILQKANVNLQNKQGNTPLHLAYVRRDTGMVQALLKAGADPKIKNKNGQTPAELAQIGYAEAYKILNSTVYAFLLSQSEYESSLKEVMAVS